MKRPLLGLLCLLGLGGCNDPVTPPVTASGGVHVPSAVEIGAEQERYYAAQLPRLESRNPEADARAAVASGKRHFLCDAGRGADEVPGIAPEDFAKVRNHCPTECLDGVTDALYGENHRRYLTAALAYSARWNQVMLGACLPNSGRPPS